MFEEYGTLTCVQCGKCVGGCAVSLRTKLNVRELMRMAVLGDATFLDAPQLWDCTTCANCSLRCPRDIKPMDVIIATRAVLVEKGKVPATIRNSLESVFNYGNPWGRSRMKRAEWANGLNIKRMTKEETIEYLLYIGCTASYDTRAIKASRAIASVLMKLDIDFGILGEEESCCGSEIKRMGEMGLFEELVERNKEQFKELNVKKLITLSPHAFNVFKNEYGDRDFDVWHYSIVLSEFIDYVKFKRNLNARVIYHDPCYLGKQNGIFEEPRKILRRIPGVKLLEFERNKSKSLCCEGGGGRMWFEGTGEGERNAVIRVKEAVELNANVIATACPFCLLTLEDAVKILGYEEEMKVMDIAEILNQALW